MKKNIINRISDFLVLYYYSFFIPAKQRFILKTNKNKFILLGENVVFKGSGTIYHAENISIDNGVHVGEDYFLMGIGGIEIGEGTIISRNVCIHSGNHDFQKGDFLPYNSNYITKKIIIGKGVWIGQNVNILPGVVIGDGAIIGMGTTVAKNVLKGEIVVSASTRSIGFRDEEVLSNLLNKRKFITHYNKKI